MFAQTTKLQSLLAAISPLQGLGLPSLARTSLWVRVSRLTVAQSNRQRADSTPATDRPTDSTRLDSQLSTLPRAAAERKFELLTQLLPSRLISGQSAAQLVDFALLAGAPFARVRSNPIHRLLLLSFPEFVQRFHFLSIRRAH